MIVILHEKRHAAQSDAMARELTGKFPGLPVQLIEAETASAWPAPETWSDALVVPFDGGPLLPQAQDFLKSLSARTTQPFILPVSLLADKKVPPGSLSSIKALPFAGGCFDQGCRRIGARLGLSIRTRDHTIFISYRQVDGLGAAVQLETFLQAEGYHVWRDDAQDKMDGQTMIAPGGEVQPQIEENLKRADLVLLLDTPRAWESNWINLEVELANGNLIPVLPVLFRRPGDRVLCSRFRLLETLQRTVPVDLPTSAMPTALAATTLDAILQEMESYLCEIFQRRLKVPHIVQQQFKAASYDWSPRDRFIYEAMRRQGSRIITRVFSHCSIFDGIYDPSLRAFVAHLANVNPRANYALYVYDGTLIPPVQLRDIERAAQLQDSAAVILLHHQEVLTVLQSNFTQLP
jgi:hypothetical protein